MDHLAAAPGPGPFKYEAEFQRWLAEHPDRLESELWIVAGELELDPVERHRVDLLGVGADGRLVVIEVKRANATREAVGQVLDYVSALEEMEPDEIADLIETASPYGELLPVTDFGQQYADRFDGAALSMLTPARIMLASTAATPAAERILRYLRNHDVDAESHSFDGHMEGGKRVYRRKRSKRARRGEEDSQQSSVDETDSRQRPREADLPQAGTKGRQDVERVHQRTKEYPGTALFRSIHGAFVRSFPRVREVAREGQDQRRQISCGIAFEMPRTSRDIWTTASRLEYGSVRLYPECCPGQVRVWMADRALELAGDHIELLDRLPGHGEGGCDCQVEEDVCNLWFTEENWRTDRFAFETLLAAINEGWEAEREAGRG